MIRRVFLFSFSLLLSFSSLHAQKRAFTIEDLYRVKNISDLHVSPDGKTIIYVVTTSDLPRAKRNSHIWAMNIDGNNSAAVNHERQQRVFAVVFAGRQTDFIRELERWRIFT